MIRPIKRTAAVFFSMLFATTMIFASPTALAEEDMSEGTSVHADISTFEKNFDLTVEQKQYAINEIITAVNIVTDTDMSDLEKYYRLALWENDRASYDHDFWSGRYYMEYYRHQWDAYGVLTDKSVCAGIAITYACLCHAAGLPCKFVRLDPKKGLDHTINYIPDINGNAYLVDVTEADFILSEKASPFGVSVDKEFAFITKDCTNHTFEYIEKPDYIVNENKKDDSSLKKDIIKEQEQEKETEGEVEYATYGTRIKDCFKTTYSAWFKEFALHQDTDKEFLEPYVEKGSGQRGVHYADYHDYPKQFSATEKPGIWFLEDFYRDPKTIESKIRNGELDEQLLKLHTQPGYDCKNAEELATQVGYDLSPEYFPSVNSETGEIVPEEVYLNYDEDYKVTCDSFDEKNLKAVVTVTGIGKYKGSFKLSVKLKAPNPMTVTGKNTTVKYSKIKKKAQTIERAKVMDIKKPKGQSEFQLVSVKKGTKNFKKYFNIGMETGDVTIAKGLKKGTYKVKVKVRSYGDDKYKETSWKAVTFKIIVK